MVAQTSANNTGGDGRRDLTLRLLVALTEEMQAHDAATAGDDAAWRDHAADANRLAEELAQAEEDIEGQRLENLILAAQRSTAATERDEARLDATVAREGLVEVRRLLDAVTLQRDTWRDQALARAEVDEEGRLNFDHLAGLVWTLLRAAYDLPLDTPEDGGRFWAAVRAVEEAIGPEEDDGEDNITPSLEEQGYTLSVDEVSGILALNRATLDELAERGVLPRVLDDGEWYYHPADLHSYFVRLLADEGDGGDAAGGGE